MAKRHKIRAYLYDNALTENPNDFLARVQSESSLNIRDISKAAATRGGANISAEAMEHAVNLWHKEMAYQLCDGFSVNTGWYTGTALIKGVFDSPNENFNSRKHTLLFDFVQGSLLRKEIDTVEVNVLGVADSSLAVLQVFDVKTASVNDLLTPERNLKISGQKLKLAGERDDIGVHFINQETQEGFKVGQSDIVVNNPAELIVVIPQLAAGTYKVAVATQFSGNSQVLLKEPRIFIFDKILTVS